MKHAALTRLSEADYLEGERASPIRHEIVEVLSPDTEAIDRRENMLAYHLIETLPCHTPTHTHPCEKTITCFQRRHR